MNDRLEPRIRIPLGSSIAIGPGKAAPPAGGIGGIGGRRAQRGPFHSHSAAFDLAGDAVERVDDRAHLSGFERSTAEPDR